MVALHRIADQIAEHGDFPAMLAPIKTNSTIVAFPMARARPQLIPDRSDLNVIIQAICNRDQQALNDLYTAQLPRVYGIAMRVLRNEADAHEVVVDVFLQIWDQADRYDATRSSVSSWIATMAYSRAIDASRRRANRPESGGLLHEEIAVHSTAIVDDSWLDVFRPGSHVQKALRGLPPLRQKLIGLAFLDGLSHQEIVAATGLALGTVKSHIRRGLLELKEQLALFGLQHA
jgi:RNA polymerase sigma factor (sigma-70 family)